MNLHITLLVMILSIVRQRDSRWFCVITTLVQGMYDIDHCCYDFSSDINDTKCCDEGVLIPRDTSDEDTVNKVTNANDVLETINELQINLDVGSLPKNKKKEVCLAFPQELQNNILNCQDIAMDTDSGCTLEQAFSCILIILIHVLVQGQANYVWLIRLS